MESLENKTNEEIRFELKKIETEHAALISKMLKDWEKLEELESMHKSGREILSDRLKVNNGGY